MRPLTFFTSSAIRIIESLLDHSAYLRELSEKTCLSSSMVHKTLLILKENGLVASTDQKNRKIFVINQKSPLAQKIVGLVMVNKIVHSVGFAQLRKTNPKSIVLFGSAHSGTMAAGSDIDLAVLFDQKFDAFKLSAIKKQLSSELKREVDLISLTPEKIREMRQQKTELLNQIRYKSTVLWGDSIEIDG